MECVVLAAGEGKRMRPLTARRPKVMLPLANRPMLEHLIVAARDAGVTGFVFVVGYGEREIRNYFQDGSRWGIRIRYVRQSHQRGTADAVAAARGLVSGIFLLLNGDMILKSPDIKALISKKPPCMAIYHSDHPEDYGVVLVEEDLVTTLDEKSDHPGSTMINAGAYLLGPEIFDAVSAVALSSRGEFELTMALLPDIRARRLTAYSLSSWMDVGHPWDLLDANETLLLESSPSIEGTVEAGVSITGPVAIGEGSVVKSGTYIEGPCIIGRNCRIGPHAYIRGATSIGDRCHIGHCTEVKNSIVMADSKIPHFNYIGDTIVGAGCNFGAGTKVANLRHDHDTVKVCGRDSRRKKFGAIIGDNVSLGINCSVNVGAVIGSDVQVAPHSLVEGCIMEHSKIR
jgi:UDP-N-acetylglucosamine diphosphorylase/glucosamine-1-phosphate N-acetyltransferase